jgi:hypothetical protein
VRNVTFNVQSGLPGFEVLKTAPLTELIQDMPRLLHYKIIPSYKVLNNLLKSGKIDAGADGGCEWPPFELSADEYNELVSELKKNNRYLNYAAPPENVENYVQWHDWVCQI